MANKSGDNSLRDWFGKSKSSDGTPGWVQLGGKYAGKPCARQPGQKTKPKCGSSKMKRNLNKKEEQKAFRRKNAKDPNPNRKGKAINVATEETTTSLFRRLLDEKKKCWKGYKKVGTQKLFGKTYNRCVKAEEVAQEGLVTGALAAGAAIGGAAYLINKAKKAAETQNDKAIGKPTIQGVTSGIRKRNERIKELMNQDYEMEGELMTEEQFDEAAGEKDACYHKVKSRYSVWPSAYASGALVKCRKVGAKNWGNKTKKEGYELGEMATEKEVDKKLQKKVSSKDLNPAEYIKNTNMMPGSGINKKLMKNSYSWRDELEYVQEGSAWTKKSGKDPDGGLNEKGRKSYERENPGSDLKRPSKKVGNKRRASFCARMKGMKKKLTSKKTANDPDSRINKSLRAWNC